VRRLLSLAVAACAAIALTAAPALASWPPSPTPAFPIPVKNAAKYVDPFSSSVWEPSRTDMGMDWASTRKAAVLAIGDAVILGSDNHAGWPGGHIIWYELLDGSHAGDIVYVAEHLTKLSRTGKLVKAGQPIAVALPGSPWTEWGWADRWGSPRAYPCYKDGRATNSGKEMERFLHSLGAPLGDPLGPGSTGPTGKLC
jgi:hypothetical protein